MRASRPCREKGGTAAGGPWLAAAVGLALIPAPALAQSVWINPAAGNWTTPANWQPAVLPTAGDDVVIDNGGEAQITTPGALARAITLGGEAATTGTLTVTSGGGLASTGTATIGGLGSGTLWVTRSPSDWTTSGDILVGDGATGTGSFTVDMGAVVTQTGAASRIVLGNAAGSTGSLSIDGGGTIVDTAGTLFVGNGGAATLRLSGGAALTDATATIASLAGSTADATVTGLDSIWTTSGALVVGGSGTATLRVEASATLADGSAALGDAAGGSGTATISGGGSTWNTTGLLAIGNAGTGSLTVEAGGAVTDTDAAIGALAGGVGDAKVTGAGSLWTSGSLLVADLGAATLTVEAGGRIVAQSAAIGNGAGSTGTALVTGSDSTWQSTDGLVVGNAGTATLTVESGGQLLDGEAAIAALAGSVGAANVDGTGSLWQTDGLLSIGNAGTATLTVEGGGAVESGSAVLAVETGSSATLSVTGIGSSWTVAKDLAIGEAGSATATVALGATATAGDTVIGDAAGGTGSLVVTDAGSTFAAGSLDVGNGGTGSLNVLLGASISAGDTTIGAAAGGTGDAVVSGLGSTLAVDGNLTVGGDGTGTLSIESSGVATTSGDAVIGAGAAGIGSAFVTGEGSDWNVAGAMTVGGPGIGELTVEQAGTLESESAVVGDGATGLGYVTVDGAGSTWSVADALTVAREGQGLVVLSGEGVIDVGGGAGTATLAAEAGSIGMLQIGDGAGAGTLAAATVTTGEGEGTLVFDHNESAYVFAPLVTGATAVQQIGSGTTILAAANDYSGDTTVEAGVLAAGDANVFSPNSAMTVASGGFLDLAGFDQTLASLANDGIVYTAGPKVGTVLTVAGNYSGSGTLVLGAALGGSQSAADRLVIGGDVSGSSRVLVLNLGGTGARTTGNGIELIDVAGTAASDAFASGRIVAGAWDYRLYQGGVGGDAGNGNWYLRSDLSLAAQTYRAYPSTITAFSLESVGTLRQRTGGWTLGPATSNLPGGAWARFNGSWGSASPSEGSPYDQGLRFGQAGVEAELPVNTASGTLSAGVMATVGHSSTTVAAATHGLSGSGTIETDAYGFGGNLTWRGRDGLYADALGQITYFDTSFGASDIGSLASSNAVGAALSLEVGQAFDVSPGWTLVPQAQLVYASASYDPIVDRDGNTVDVLSGDSLLGRAGLRVEHVGFVDSGIADAIRYNAYLVANISYSLIGGGEVALGDTVLDQSSPGLAGELGLGGTLLVTGRTSLYGELAYAAGFSGDGTDTRWSGDFGLRIQW